MGGGRPEFMLGAFIYHLYSLSSSISTELCFKINCSVHTSVYSFGSFLPGPFYYTLLFFFSGFGSSVCGLHNPMCPDEKLLLKQRLLEESIASTEVRRI